MSMWKAEESLSACSRWPQRIKFPICFFLLALSACNAACFAQSKSEIEIIQASARGTSTQMAQVTHITIHVYEYSNHEDRQILIGAFEKGQNEGLVNALEKMR